jgi:hypothetical protein
MASLFIPPKTPKSPKQIEDPRKKAEEAKAQINKQRLRSGGGFRDTIFGAAAGKKQLGA